jgi:hypothetical protein
MNNFVAITKTYGDINDKVFPAEWPMECEEFETRDLALAKYPGKPVLSIAEYRLFSAGLALAHKLIPKPTVKPWWRFW